VGSHQLSLQSAQSLQPLGPDRLPHRCKHKFAETATTACCCNR
jgi:hypothetical protein